MRWVRPGRGVRERQDLDREMRTQVFGKGPVKSVAPCLGSGGERELAATLEPGWEDWKTLEPSDCPAFDV